MGTTSMKNDLEKIKAEWAGAPIMVKTMAGPYIGPIFQLFERLIDKVEGVTNGD